MPRDPMPDCIVLLPGICGSVLRKDGRDVWALSGQAGLGALLSLGQSIAGLRLTDDPPDVEDLGDGVTPDRLIGDVHLVPYLWKIDGYTKVADAIKAAFDVTPGRNFFEFPYDWRRDNRASALRLQRMSRQWLRDWRASSGNVGAKLILVGHSMGGIVARYFLEVLDGWRDARALITFGTPYRGALNALDYLANGMKKGPAGIVDLSGLIRSLTSVYQLLPIYECFDPGDGTLVRVGETGAIPGVDAPKAAAALAFHREIEQAVDAHRAMDDYVRDAYKIFPIVGTHQPTQQSARRSGAGVEMLRVLRGRDTGGDGTVPRGSATPKELAGEGREMFAATRHASLQNADAVLAHLQGVITGLYLPVGDFFAAPFDELGLGLDLEDAYWSDEPVAFRVQGTPGADLVATVADTETGREVARVPLRTDDNPWTSAESPHLPAGIYRMTIGGDARVEPVTDVFTVFDHD